MKGAEPHVKVSPVSGSVASPLPTAAIAPETTFEMLTWDQIASSASVAEAPQRVCQSP